MYNALVMSQPDGRLGQPDPSRPRTASEDRIGTLEYWKGCFGCFGSIFLVVTVVALLSAFIFFILVSPFAIGQLFWVICLIGPDGVSKRYAQNAKTRNETRIILQYLRSTAEQGFTPTKLILDDWFCDPQLKPRSIEDRATHIKRIVSVIGGFNITSVTAPIMSRNFTTR